MRVMRCPRCRKMYEFDGAVGEGCPDCRNKEEQDYKNVREYVKQHPGVTMDEVSRALDVPHSKVIQYLREERLEIVKLSQSFLRCDKCAKLIVTGTRCEDCKKRFGYS